MIINSYEDVTCYDETYSDTIALCTTLPQDLILVIYNRAILVPRLPKKIYVRP
jgi:hypothetical protein